MPSYSVLVTAATLWAPLAAAHAVLKASNPAPGAVLASAPAELALTFNENIEPAFSKVTVLAADGRNAAPGKATVDGANPALVRLTLPALAASEYTVKWAVAGRDGHRPTGEFKFTVK